MLAQAGAHFNPTSSRSWSWIRRCRRSWSWSCRHRCHCCFFLLANVAVRQCVSTSVCQSIGQSIITRFGCRRVQIKLVIVPPRSMAAIKYTAHSPSLSLSQSRSQSQSLIPNHSLGLLQTPPPTLSLRGAESREILSSSTCLAIKMLHASSAWRAESVSPAESRKDFNCSVRPQMSFTFELRQRGRAFCGSYWMGGGWPNQPAG